jgi:hypothetical protein
MILCVLVLCLAMANSQVLGQTKGLRYRETRRAVLELLEDYNRQIGREGDNVYVFQNLFSDSNAILSNDILMENMLDEKLTLKEYESRRDKYYSYRMIHLNDIVINKLGKLKYAADSSGSVDVIVSREVQWSMKRQDYFIYIDTIVQKFTVNFEQRKSDIFCKIASITNTTFLGKHLLLRAAYQQNKDVKWLLNDTLLINDHLYTTDQNGYVQIKRLHGNKVIYVKALNPEFHQKKKVRLDNMQSLQGVSELRFRVPKWIFELQSGFMPFRYRSIQTNNYTSNSQYDYLLGLSLGRSITKTSKWEWLAKLDFIQTWHKTLLSSPDVYYSYNAYDPDNFEYIRQITISDITEQLNVEITAVGLGLGGSYKLNKRNSLQAEIGYQHVVRQTATSSRKGNALFGGFYPELFGVSIFENGIYDFGNFELAESSVAINSNISGLYTCQLRMSTKLSRTSSIQYGLLYRQSTIRVDNGAQQLRLSSAPNQLNSLLQTNDVWMLRFINFALGYQYKF